LSELSGGQRSLVALSLILAMLKFKPAPFYILDEIDAALDMSHTENIGKMIKNHFSQSQVHKLIICIQNIISSSLLSR
jgi:structural maintenance of chromosome 2